MAERLQKVLARAGIASRRGAEKIIEAGRVRVNGQVVREMGVKVDPRNDKVEVDGKRIVAEEFVYYLLHKPRETVSTVHDPEGRDTVLDLMRGVTERIFPVGRLDYHTSGALLMTNDGRLSEALLRPRVRVPKVYRAKINKVASIEALERLRNGIILDDGYETQPAEVFVERQEATKTILNLTLTEGKNRQVHRMLEALGYRVNRLHRISMADLDVLKVRPGEYRPLNKKEVADLKKKYQVPYEAWQKSRAK